MRALIADDDRVTAAILSRSLSRWNLDVVEAHDGDAAWRLLCETPGASLAIIDWMMPGLDGLELCRRIRRSAALATMHVILVTARDGQADIVAGLEAGADDYIVKPFDLEELQARVHVGIRVATLQDRLAAHVAELEVARDELARQANTDSLTGLCSRRRWFDCVENEFSRYRRYRQPFAVLMADLDFFKRVNDTFGHSVGDEVLRQFAGVLRSKCRTSDCVGRIGGEEFAVLLSETTMASAEVLAQRIMESCRGVVVPSRSGDVRFTCSIGVAEACASDEAVEAIVQRADTAMYLAKNSGRDCVRVGTERPVSTAEIGGAVSGGAAIAHTAAFVSQRRSRRARYSTR